jgi:hypothetical protein
MTVDASGRRESVMAQLSLATDRPVTVVSRRGNVLPFVAQRRSSRIREGSVAQPGVSDAVVVRLPVAMRERRQREASVVNAKANSPDGSEQRFTSFDYVATAVLILSVFAAPALVWAMLRSASFG